MQQQVRVLASEKGELAQQLHSEQTRTRQHHAQVGTPLQPDHQICMTPFDIGNTYVHGMERRYHALSSMKLQWTEMGLAQRQTAFGCAREGISLASFYQRRQLITRS